MSPGGRRLELVDDTVRCSSWASATAMLNASVVLPTPPFGAKIEKILDMPPAEVAACSFWTALIRVMRSNPENGIARTPWMPAAESVSTGFWGTVRTMTGTPSPEAFSCSTAEDP